MLEGNLRRLPSQLLSSHLCVYHMYFATILCARLLANRAHRFNVNSRRWKSTLLFAVFARWHFAAADLKSVVLRFPCANDDDAMWLGDSPVQRKVGRLRSQTNRLQRSMSEQKFHRDIPFVRLNRFVICIRLSIEEQRIKINLPVCRSHRFTAINVVTLRRHNCTTHANAFEINGSSNNCTLNATASLRSMHAQHTTLRRILAAENFQRANTTEKKLNGYLFFRAMDMSFLFNSYIIKNMLYIYMYTL